MVTQSFGPPIAATNLRASLPLEQKMVEVNPYGDNDNEEKPGSIDRAGNIGNKGR